MSFEDDYRMFLYYRINEDFEIKSWQDLLIRNSRRISFEKYKYKAQQAHRARRFTNKVRLMKRSKRLTEPKDQKPIMNIDIRLPNYRIR